MNDSVRYHLISLGVAIAALAMVIHAELIAPGVQILLNTEGQANGPFFNLLSMVFEALLILAAIIAVGGLLEYGFGVRVAWAFVVLVVVAFFATAGWMDFAIRLSQLPIGVELILEKYILPMAMSLIALIAAIATCARRRMRQEPWVLFVLFCLPFLSLIWRLVVTYVGQDRYILFDTYFVESALFSAFVAALVLGLLIAGNLKPSRERVVTALAVIGLGVVMTSGALLGRQGMPRRYMDYPEPFATWMKVYSTAWFLLAALLVVLAIRAAYRPEQT